jgi:hypothetical protein
MAYLYAIVIFFCVHSFAFADQYICHALVGNTAECTKRNFHLFGSTEFFQWRRGSELIPFKISVEGAKSGTILYSQFQLRLDQDLDWAIFIRDDHIKKLFKKNSLFPSAAVKIDGEGIGWDFVVTKMNIPKEMPGIATEGEVNLNIEITRK